MAKPASDGTSDAVRQSCYAPLRFYCRIYGGTTYAIALVLRTIVRRDSAFDRALRIAVLWRRANDLVAARNPLRCRSFGGACRRMAVQCQKGRKKTGISQKAAQAVCQKVSGINRVQRKRHLPPFWRQVPFFCLPPRLQASENDIFQRIIKNYKKI